MPITGRHGTIDQFQENLIKGVNAFAKPELPLIKNGMCYMLTLHWILEYLNTNSKDQNTAATVFDLMTVNIAALRQIAQNFSSYKSNELKYVKLGNDGISWTKLIKEQVCDFVMILSKQTRTAHFLLSDLSIFPHSDAFSSITLVPQTEAYLILFKFKCKEEIHGHAIGMIANANNDFRIYDPNCGIYTSTVLTDVFATILPGYTDELKSVTVDIILIR